MLKALVADVTCGGRPLYPFQSYKLCCVEQQPAILTELQRMHEAMVTGMRPNEFLSLGMWTDVEQNSFHISVCKGI